MSLGRSCGRETSHSRFGPVCFPRFEQSVDSHTEAPPWRGIKIQLESSITIISIYRIWPNYRPCSHNRPPLTFYFIFTYYRPLEDLFPDLLLYFHLLSPTWRSFGTSGREQIYVSARAPIRSNTVSFDAMDNKLLHEELIYFLFIALLYLISYWIKLWLYLSKGCLNICNTRNYFVTSRWLQMNKRLIYSNNYKLLMIHVADKKDCNRNSFIVIFATCLLSNDHCDIT